MISESELLDTFDLDELDGTSHPCAIVLFTGATGFLRGLNDDLVAEGKRTLSSVNRHGSAEVLTSLTINEMIRVTARWSCIKEIIPLTE